MIIIDNHQIEGLRISNQQCLDWVQEALNIKSVSYLPAKESIKPEAGTFFTSMPCLIPTENVYGLKMVSRIPGREPSLDSDLLLYDSHSGELKALMEADWITAMRTGAVAAYTILHLAPNGYNTISCIGLGSTCKATLDVLLPLIKRPITIQLKKYKDQAEKIVKRYEQYANVTFVIVEDDETFFKNADVIISCITCTDTNLAKDEWFKPNVLVVPIHTMGFQNCDVFFDRVIIDDYEHTKKFKYFNEFKNVTELKDVPALSDAEKQGRIIAYNVGIALHDVYFAKKIYGLISANQ